MDPELYHQQAERLLLRLGVHIGRRQGLYLLTALHLIHEDPSRLQFVTKWLYPAVAAACHSSLSAVERGIRLACDKLWYHGNYELLMRIVLFDRDEPPAPSLMLAYLYHHLLSICINESRP